MKELPIACTLTPGALQQRRDELLTGIIKQAEAREWIPNGLRLRFPASSRILADLARMIDAERQCCRFFTFQLRVEPDFGPIWLEVHAPPAAAELIASLLGQ